MGRKDKGYVGRRENRSHRGRKGGIKREEVKKGRGVWREEEGAGVEEGRGTFPARRLAWDRGFVLGGPGGSW